MKLQVDAAGVTLRDNPGLWWALALLFAGVGAALLAIGLRRQAGVPPWQSMLATLFGLIGVAAGVTVAWRSPGTTVALSLATRQVTVAHTGAFGRRRRVVAFDQIARVDVEHSHDDEGNTVARPVLSLRNGETVVLSALWQHDVEGVRSATVALATALRGAVPRAD